VVANLIGALIFARANAAAGGLTLTKFADAEGAMRFVMVSVWKTTLRRVKKVKRVTSLKR